MAIRICSEWNQPATARQDPVHHPVGARSSYPAHRSGYSSLPRPYPQSSSSSSSRPLSTPEHHSLPRHHSYSNYDASSSSPYRFRSITSPEAKNGTQTRSRTPLRSVISAGALQGNHQLNGRGQQLMNFDLTTMGSSQGSQTDYPVSSGHPPEFYPISETASEHSLSDSTQASEISEPTYRRPR